MYERTFTSGLMEGEWLADGEQAAEALRQVRAS